jgi:hypothetical protein
MVAFVILELKFLMKILQVNIENMQPIHAVTLLCLPFPWFYGWNRHICTRRLRPSRAFFVLTS